ncbi:MAG: fimbria/pilus periplasmic chaperone [Pseudomonadota bacterium]
MNFRTSVFVLAGVFVYSLGVYADIMIAPTRMETGLEKPSTESFVVKNNSTDNIKMSITPDVFDTKGITTKYDISKYININPKMIKLKAGQSRTVRVSLRPDAQLKKGKGEYYARIFFKTVEKEQKGPKKPKKEEPNVLQMDINLVFNVSIPVYGSLGKGTSEMKAECETEKDDTLKIKVTNAGLWRFDGSIVLYGKDGKTELAKERLLMPRGYTKDIELKLKPEDIKVNEIPITFTSLEDRMKVKVLTNKCLLVKK